MLNDEEMEAELQLFVALHLLPGADTMRFALFSRVAGVRAPLARHFCSRSSAQGIAAVMSGGNISVIGRLRDCAAAKFERKARRRASGIVRQERADAPK